MFSGRCLGFYLSVWHCYLGSILAFFFEIVKLNTTTCTKSSTQVIKVNLDNMNSLFPTLMVNNSACMYLFIRINSDWLIIWRIYCAHAYLSRWEATVFSLVCSFVCMIFFVSLFFCFFAFYESWRYFHKFIEKSALKTLFQPPLHIFSCEFSKRNSPGNFFCRPSKTSHLVGLLYPPPSCLKLVKIMLETCYVVRK